MFYLVLVGKRAILIDTGFTNTAYVRMFRIKGYVQPHQLLSRVGLKPAAITDVVLTHSHFDHIDAVHRYRRARIYLQKSEYRRLLASRGLGRAKKALRQAKRDGRLHLITGRHQLHPKVLLEPSGGHTRGSQAVFIQAAKKRYIVVGDECYLLQSCVNGRPLPALSAENPKKNRVFLQRLKKDFARGGHEILPLHDPVLMKNYPQSHPHIIRVR